MTVRAPAFLLALCGLACLRPALADDLFRVSVMPLDPGVEPLTVGGASVPDLVEDLLDTQEQFARFDGVDFDASLRYAGVDDAITFSLSDDGNRATLQFLGRSGDPLVFVSDETGDVEDKIVDFLEKDGSATVADFLKEVNRRSLVAVTDGNPQATTAQMAAFKYNRFGKHQDLTRLERRIMRGEVLQQAPQGAPSPGVFRAVGQDGSDQPQGMQAVGGASGFQQESQDGPGGPGGPGGERMEGESAPVGAASVQWFQPGSDRGLRIRLDAQAGIADADGLESTFVNLAGSVEYRVNRFWGVAFSVPISYYDVDGADVFTAAAHLDVPIRLVQRDDGKGFTFQIAPGALLAGSGSYEMVAGGLFWGIGATALASYETDRWLLSAAASYTHFDSISLSLSEFEFDPDLTQDFVRVGGKASYFLGDNAYVFAGASYSDFLDEAAVDNYWSPTAGLGVRTAGGFNVRLAYEGDFGDDYEAHKVQLGVQLPF
ncbi:MAG: hypothetical protein KatS3mg103_0719 [Phycisphaerales bacterium]|nr:MAG: hypothetical protein KatS3mg103_0719 [Phycisphaerales bacterium]